MISRSTVHLVMYFVAPSVWSTMLCLACLFLTSSSRFLGVVGVVSLWPGWAPVLRFVFSLVVADGFSFVGVVC